MDAQQPRAALILCRPVNWFKAPPGAHPLRNPFPEPPVPEDAVTDVCGDCGDAVYVTPREANLVTMLAVAGMAHLLTCFTCSIGRMGGQSGITVVL